MVEIAAFRGMRYNLDRVGRLEHVTAPPFDVISPEMSERLYELSPYNVIRLILGKREPDDTPKNNRYTRAAALLSQWLKDDILARDKEPGIYAYYQDFDREVAGKITRATRKGFVARLRLSAYQESKVLPHERTLHGPKEDRLKLITQCRANFSQVFSIFQEKDQKIYELLDSRIESREPWQFLDENNVRHSMWPVTDQATISRITGIMNDLPIIIADGHHRYETCLNYYRYLDKKMPLLMGSAQYTVSYFTEASDPGLVIYPYHRIIRKLPRSRFRGLVKKLTEFFDIEKTLNSPMAGDDERVKFIEKLGELGRNKPSFGMVDMEKGDGYFLVLKRDRWKAFENPSLDVIMLEELVLKDILRIPARALFEGKYVIYETDCHAAARCARTEDAQIVFFMNAIPVELVIDRALAHRVMPEKSTYFFPKLASGLVMNLLDD